MSYLRKSTDTRVSLRKSTDILDAASVDAATAYGWSVTRTTRNVYTIERTARQYENGILVGAVHHWVHFMADGTTLVYAKDLDAPYGLYRLVPELLWFELIFTDQVYSTVEY